MQKRKRRMESTAAGVKAVEAMAAMVAAADRQIQHLLVQDGSY